MSDLDPIALRRDLLLQAAVGRRLDDLVRRANAAAALLQGRERMEESQLRNLLNVAVTSRSSEVVINFIRYQIARSRDTWGTSDNDFGHSVIKDLETHVLALAALAAGEVRQALPDQDEAALTHEAYTRLMQLYLGYLNRAFYYGKKTGDFDRLRAKEVSS